MADHDDWVASARNNLGLSDAATKTVGTTAGTVAAGDDARIVNPASVPLVANQQSAAYTLVSTDIGKMVEMSTGAAVTIPPNSSVAFPVGTVVSLCQTGASIAGFAAGSGVTLHAPNGSDCAAQWSVITAWQQAVDVWVISGDTA